MSVTIAAQESTSAIYVWLFCSGYILMEQLGCAYRVALSNIHDQPSENILS